MDSPSPSTFSANRIACIGGAVINRKYHARQAIIAGTSNPSTSHRTFGGVARNVAETLARLEAQVTLVSALGDDEAGRAIAEHMTGLGVAMDQTLIVQDSPTAEYVALLDASGELYVGIAAMDVFDALTPELLATVWPAISRSDWIFADCNLPADTLQALLDTGPDAAFRLAVNTVSAPKASRLPDDLSAIDVLFTNADEAEAMLDQQENAPEKLARGLRARGARHVVLTLGAEGHLVASGDDVVQVSGLAANPVDVTGAGDALMAGTLYGLMEGRAIAEASRLGTLLATLTLESDLDVPPDLSPALLDAHANRLARITTKTLHLS